MKLTKKKAIELHRELWDWLYGHPSKAKEDWPRWIEHGGTIPPVKDDCFLCEYARGPNGGFPNCSSCPLDWGPTFYCALSSKSYFVAWAYSKTPKTRKKYAKIIRDLPEK